MDIQQKGIPMKLKKSGDRQKLLQLVGHNPDLYDVQAPRGTITIIDREENIQDYFPNTTLLYRIDEAEALLEFMQNVYSDYDLDPYYKQGTPLYPVYSYINDIKIVDKVEFSSNIIVYRYQVAGEWIYGITNKWTDDERPYRSVEAPMDGWQKWLDDRHKMLKDKWIADNYGNFND